MGLQTLPAGESLGQGGLQPPALLVPVARTDLLGGGREGRVVPDQDVGQPHIYLLVYIHARLPSVPGLPVRPCGGAGGSSAHGGAEAAVVQLCWPSHLWKTTAGLKAEDVPPVASARRGGLRGGSPRIWSPFAT